MIFLDRLSGIDAAIKNKSYVKFFHGDKIGQSCLLAFDEAKRMLVLCVPTRVCPYFSISILI